MVSFIDKSARVSVVFSLRIPLVDHYLWDKYLIGCDKISYSIIVCMINEILDKVVVKL